MIDYFNSKIEKDKNKVNKAQRTLVMIEGVKGNLIINSLTNIRLYKMEKQFSLLVYTTRKKFISLIV